MVLHLFVLFDVESNSVLGNLERKEGDNLEINPVDSHLLAVIWVSCSSSPPRRAGVIPILAVGMWRFGVYGGDSASLPLAEHWRPRGRFSFRCSDISAAGWLQPFISPAKPFLIGHVAHLRGAWRDLYYLAQDTVAQHEHR